MKNDRLRISEQFYSLQGEGITMGVPSVFVRLQACNIVCDGEWVCDTIEVWKTGDTTPVMNWVVDLKKWIPQLKKGAHLIFTGGEPLLQQKAIVFAINYFKRVWGFKPFIEIETNGTLMPDDDFIESVDLINCSFKLKNSGVREDRRIKIDVLKKINTTNSIFKIVVGSKEDYKEARKIFDEVGIENKNIWLMPPGDNQKEIDKKSQITSQICIEEGINFSSRLQVVLWNKTTGV